MATIIHLCEQEIVHKYDAGLSWRDQEERLIYVTTRAKSCLETQLPNMVSDRNLEITPLEQVVEFLEQFCKGGELCFERQFHPVQHVKDGIWVLKTPDVRMFGWFPRKDCFIMTACSTKYLVKTHSLVTGFRDEAVRFRNQLELDEPKFVDGEDPANVLSAYNYPPP